MGSAPVTNMQPQIANPGAAQMRPGMGAGMPPGQGAAPQGAPQMGTPTTPVRPGMAPQANGANPQQLATALTQLNGGMR